MRRVLLGIMMLCSLVCAADNITVPPQAGKAYLTDSLSRFWPAMIGYTTDGNGHVYTLNGTLVAGDNITVPPQSGDAYLTDNQSRFWPAMILYTTDGNGQVQPITGGGSSPYPLPSPSPSGFYVKSTGTSYVLSSVPGASPGGSQYSIQTNNGSGSFAGDSYFKYNGSQATFDLQDSWGGLHVQGKSGGEASIALQPDNVSDGSAGQWILATNGSSLSNSKDFGLYNSPSGIALYAQQSTNNIGIGNTNPQARLHVTGGNLQVGDSGNDRNMIFGGTNSGIYWASSGAEMYYTVGDIIINPAGSTNGLTIQNATGYLGLGTNGPATQLDVNGTATASQYIDSGLTANTVVYANGSKQLTSSSATPSDLTYLHNYPLPTPSPSAMVLSSTGTGWVLSNPSAATYPLPSPSPANLMVQSTGTAYQLTKDTNGSLAYSNDLTTMTVNAVGPSPVPSVGVLLQNTTVSLTGARQQNSPELISAGHAWGTTPSGDKVVAWRQYVQALPPPGSGPASSEYNLDWTVGSGLNGTWTNALQVTEGGTNLAGTTHMLGQFLASGAGTFNGIVNFNSTTDFYSTSTFHSPIIGQGASFSGNVGVSADLTVNSSISDLGPLSVSGLSTLSGITNTGVFNSTAIPFTTGNPTGNSVSLVSAPDPSFLTAIGSAVQNTAHLGLPPFSGLPTQDDSGTGFIANDSSYEYILYSYNGSGQYSIIASDTGGFSDDNSGSPFQWDIAWSAGPSLDTISGYLLGRNINGAGYAYQDVGNVTSYNDNNQDPFADSAPSSLVPDYLALNTTRTYSTSGFGTGPSGIMYFSQPSSSYGFTDDGSNTPYTVAHTLSNTLVTSTNRVIGAPDGSSANGYFDATGGSFIEDSSSYSGGATVTPIGYGIQANGTNLNIFFSIYGSQTLGGIEVFSATPGVLATTDPGDSNFYYIQGSFNAGVGNTSYSIIPNNYFSGSTIQTSTSFTFDNNSPFGGSTTTTPTSAVGNAGTFISNPVGTTDQAQLVIQNSTGDYGRLDFLDYTGTATGSLSCNAADGFLFDKNVGVTGNNAPGNGFGLHITNNDGGDGSNGTFNFGNDATYNLGGMAVFSSGTSTSGLYKANSLYMYGTGVATQIAINMESNGPILFGTNNTERMKIANTTGTVTMHSGLALDGGNIQYNVAGTTYNGSVSGSAVWTMPFQGTTYKKFVIYFNALHDAGGTITFPTAFTQTPYVYGDSAAVAVSSASTTTFTIAVAATITGNVFVEGE